MNGNVDHWTVHTNKLKFQLNKEKTSVMMFSIHLDTESDQCSVPGLWWGWHIYIYNGTTVHMNHKQSSYCCQWGYGYKQGTRLGSFSASVLVSGFSSFSFFLLLDACYSWNDVANRFLMGCDQVQMDVCLYIYTTEKCGTLIQSALGMHSSACSKHCMLNIYLNTSLSTSTTYYIYCYLQGISFMESFLKLSVFLFCKVCHYCWCSICHIS